MNGASKPFKRHFLINLLVELMDEVFDFLKIKVSSFGNSSDKHCAIVFDEMSIAPGRVFDPSTNTYLGNATIPDSKGQFLAATHGFAVMLV
ncbi:hypothetical protein PV325_012434 [Microctonus aethiopoides]|nr:hypothetical protein PV325_012434 [Microctonus aethiopoides]